MSRLNIEKQSIAVFFLFFVLFSCKADIKITCCQWCDCEEYLRTDTESVHNITCCLCTSGTDMKIPTCRIRSPSFMRPSFAAMLFGSTCTKEVENQCWQPITTQLCISKRQQRCTTLAPPLFYVMLGEKSVFWYRNDTHFSCLLFLIWFGLIFSGTCVKRKWRYIRSSE